jgi:hypothetical protein
MSGKEPSDLDREMVTIDARVFQLAPISGG